MNRRHFVQLSGGGLTALAAPTSPSFRFAVLADTHIIDSFYKGPEGSPEDTESIFKTSERLSRTTSHLNSLKPDLAFIAGDLFHNYPSEDLDFYFKNETRLDVLKKHLDAFRMPVHCGFGNHDYSIGKLTREFSHELFRRKLSLEPYYAVEHKGFQFLHLNNFLGDTMTPGHAKFDKKLGSFGETQLQWLQARLEKQLPTFVFLHFPLSIVAPREYADLGLLPLLKKHRDSIRVVFAGHWHRWFEFGRSYGPQHQVLASTRYDENAYLIVEADAKSTACRLLNIDGVDWNTHFSKPWPPR